MTIQEPRSPQTETAITSGDGVGLVPAARPPVTGTQLTRPGGTPQEDSAAPATTYRPMILLGVDGVLNPWYRPGRDWRVYRAVTRDVSHRVVLNPAHGPMLLALAEQHHAELAWATAWGQDANTQIGARIGLPELPVIDVDAGLEDARLNAKVPPVADRVARRPFVWFDSGLGRRDRGYLRGHPGVGAFSIVHVDPRQGLAESSLRAAARWLQQLTDREHT